MKMKPLTIAKLASRSLAIKQARQTINRTLVIVCKSATPVFDENRVAELQACAVILARAESDLWAAWNRMDGR